MKSGRIKKAGIIAKNLTVSILRGEIVLKLDPFLPHILVLAVLCTVAIFANLKIDQTLVEREKNRRTLEEAKICYAQKVCQLAEARQINNVSETLSEKGIEVGMPEKPATIIRRK